MLLKAKAYAKLNLFLDVLGIRSDGFHDIDSIMQSVSLCDEIEISSAVADEVTVSYNDPSFYREDDIIFKACEAFFDYSGCKCGLDIKIAKNIPTVAGLGGFSADVAAILKMLNIISGKNYSDEIMLSLCQKLGSDVPFCYNGGTARAGSVGDALQKLDDVKLYYVFVKELEKQSTGALYSKLDSMNISSSGNIDLMLSGIEENDPESVAASVYNVFDNCWDFDAMTGMFKEYQPNNVLLCGSGPTVAAVFTCKDKAETCYESLLEKNIAAFYAESVTVGNIVE